jgi:hypothetical protein
LASTAGLVVRDLDDSLLLCTWRTLALGGPHHHDGLQLLGLARDEDEVVAYVTLDPDGACDVSAGPAGSDWVTESQVLALDDRLRPPPPLGDLWHFV